MKRIIAATIISLAASSAMAQQKNPPANQDPSTPAVTSPKAGNNPGAPAAGANSFTEDQAKSRIEAQGFTNVSGLAKDKDGVWRGKASKGGKNQDVSLDYQGNIVAK